MAKQLFSVQPLMRSDYYVLGGIILYSVYAYLCMGGVLNAYNATGVSAEGSPPLSIMHILVPLLVIASAYYLLIRHTWNSFTWGLNLSKGFWTNFIITAVAAGLFLLSVQFAFSSESVGRLVPVLLNITASELVFRVALIGLITRLLGQSNNSVFLAITVSGALYVLVQSPFQLTWWSILGSVALSGLYHKTRTILFSMFFSAFLFLGDSDFPDELPFVVLVFALYFMLATAALLIHRSRSQESRVGDVRT